MFVSHRHKFIVFSDPMGACPWIERALQPWLDQPVASTRHRSAETMLFRGMSPAEAALAFDMMGLPFHAYRRIAIIRNPFAKMAQLYYRISMTDPLWRTRDYLGLDSPRFHRWLLATRPFGPGAGYRKSARWRRHGAWSADAWCGDHVTDMVAAQDAARGLIPIFEELGLHPAFGKHLPPDLSQHRLAKLYDEKSTRLIHQRYATDLRVCGLPPAVAVEPMPIMAHPPGAVAA